MRGDHVVVDRSPYQHHAVDSKDAELRAIELSGRYILCLLR